MDNFVKTFSKYLKKSHTAIQNNEYEYIMNANKEELKGMEAIVIKDYRDRLSKNRVITSFKSKNVNGWEIIPLKTNTGIFDELSLLSAFNGNSNESNCSLYAIKAPSRDDIYEDLTPGKLFNINNNSPYNIDIEGDTTTINFFLRKDLLAKDPSTLEGKDLEVYILDIRGCMFHFANFRCGNILLENSINILTNNLTVAIVRHLVPITPAIVSEIFKTNVVVAESLIDAYDLENEKFINLPWMI